MGCISSKFMPRSMSFPEELGQSIQRSATLSGKRDFATSKTTDDQFLVNSKLRSEGVSKSYITPTLEPDKSLNSDTLEFRSCLEHEAQKKQEPHVLMVMQCSPQDNLIRRSLSYHWLPENKVLSPYPESLNGPEEENNDYRSLRKRAWSFHTIEDYDALLEKIRLSTTLQSDSRDHGSMTEVQLNASQSSLHPVDHKGDPIEYDRDVIHIQEMQPSNPEVSPKDNSKVVDKASQEVNSTSVDTSTLIDLELENRTPAANPSTSGATEETEAPKHSFEEDTLEKGSKRKFIAKNLKSLEVPQSIQFQAVASLREWLDAGGQVHSPGRYITPKFGSDSLPNSGTANEYDDQYIFNPELVAAFEGCMQQLEEEAEIIFGQIGVNLEEETAVEKKQV
ncbi:hypothetical protein K2173_009037 [Erythroxylum novogranatense]|uniref:Uncharacterized protein n=1 Tax=Erythroxylum novogranatense TaxID=1862640 RepID=A0AAV8TUQ2_9ROSI|nr:hypothetical protein K2173_009037 [Erythroxylum novogranatense]